jgi:hypothetical protein
LLTARSGPAASVRLLPGGGVVQPTAAATGRCGPGAPGIERTTLGRLAGAPVGGQRSAVAAVPAGRAAVLARRVAAGVRSAGYRTLVVVVDRVCSAARITAPEMSGASSYPSRILAW